MDDRVLRRILKQLKRERYQVSTKAEKFINDLNAEIELGWTGPGQTNYLLGRITMREYIFRHILNGGHPLSGETLVDAIVEVAQSLPGYFEYCRHRHKSDTGLKNGHGELKPVTTSTMETLPENSKPKLLNFHRKMLLSKRRLCSHPPGTSSNLKLLENASALRSPIY